MMIELEELYDKKRELQSRKSSYFDEEFMHYGDFGYQAILSELEEVEDEIKELEDKL